MYDYILCKDFAAAILSCDPPFFFLVPLSHFALFEENPFKSEVHLVFESLMSCGLIYH